jgi:putative ABC transport system permease protein
MFPLGLHWLRRFDLLPTNTPQRIGIDATTLTFVAALAVVLALAMTLSARWLQSANTFTTLKQGGTRQSAGTTAQRTRQVLVILQIGMTAALLVGTGLLLRSAHHLLNEDVGFNRDGLLIASLNLSPADADAAGLHAPVCSICERAASLPGVSKVGISNFAPFGGSSYASDYQAPDSTVTDAAATRIAYYNSNVSADYFSALGLPIVSGRAFSADEVRNASPVAIVDGDFVKRNFGDRNPIGQTFLARGGKRVTIIGVAATVKRATLNETIERPTIYLPGMEGNDYQILVRTKIDPATLIPSLKAMIHELAPTASLDGITTMSALIESTIADRTRLNTLLELLGAVALVLAAVGLYAVLAYAVRMRRSEFGIRLALGAAPARVTREVLAQGLRLVAIGLGLGLPLAYAAAQLIAARLYRTTPLDPPTLIVVALLIAAIGLLASWWPARNAARVDPMTALRQE